ncbi:peptidoglycan-binding domain-containing protein [Stappia sediminis]|uniref:peptidoglycan-binding domain-containing protein n=1 Tax=Stappia sediminis TaxID=2692190 RepID=UPI0028AB608F|nr:peptidoglycan-binding domain-containing protein [Stappia sediminis]
MLDLTGEAASRIGNHIAFDMAALNTVTNGWRDILVNGLRQAYDGSEYIPAWKTSETSQLAYVQRLLNERGYGAGAVDGRMGRRTRGAIRGYQRDNGLESTGEVTGELVVSLEGAEAPALVQMGRGKPLAEITGPIARAPAAGTEEAGIAAPPAAAGGVPDQVREQSACAASVSQGPWSSPVRTLANYIFFSDGADAIRVDDAPGVRGVDAGDGDDRIYISDSDTNVGIVAGAGADRIFVCSMSTLSLQVNLSSEESLGGDNSLDEIVFEPAVFTGVPDGFDRQIRILSFTNSSDRIRLKLPPGVDFTFMPNSSVIARAGPVSFNVARADSVFAVTRDAFVIERVGAPEAVDPIIAGPPLSNYDETQGCQDADAMRPAEPVGMELMHAFYSPQGNAIRIDRKQGVTIHDTGGGDDIVYTYTSQNLHTGQGSDRIFICGMDDPLFLVDVQQDTIDAEPDLVVVEAARLLDGVKRSIVVGGIAKPNDRIILRLPEGVEADIDQGGTRAKVGSLTVDVAMAGWRRELKENPDIFIIERTRQTPVAPSGFAPPPELSGLVCSPPDEAAQSMASVNASDGSTNPPLDTGDNDLIFFGRAGIASLDGREGDDTLIFYDPRPDTSVTAGPGNDKIMLCTIDALTFNVSLGANNLQPDLDADGVILGPDVFLGVPDGIQRYIRIFGFMPENDRVLMRLPPGKSVTNIRDATGTSVEIRVGNVVVTLYGADTTRREPFGREVIITETAEPLERSFASGAPAGVVAPTEKTCPDLSVDRNFSERREIVSYGTKTVHYSEGDDRALIDDTPGLQGFSTGGGNDVVYVFDPLETTSVNLGPGEDTLIICSFREISFSVIVGPHDIETDTVVLSPNAFRNIPPGMTRQISVFNVGLPNDRVILQVPDGMSVSYEKSLEGERYVVGDTEVYIYPSDEKAAEHRKDFYVIENAGAAGQGTGSFSPRHQRDKAPASDDASTLQDDKGCIPIRLTAMNDMVEVSGVAPPEDVTCYRISSNANRLVRVEVLRGANIVFSLKDIVDAQTHYIFPMRDKPVEMVVGQLMRSVQDEAYRVRIAVQGL